MEQYATKFMDLGRFNPCHISTKSMRMERFQDGLQERIRAHVACIKIKDFQKLVH